MNTRDDRYADTIISGKQITKLMRQHKVTIRTLAFRMQITMKRIREVRNGEGFIWSHQDVRSWIEFITGRDPGLDVIRYKVHVWDQTGKPIGGQRSADVMSRVIFDM